MRWLRVYVWALLFFLWAPLLLVIFKGCNLSAFERLFQNTEVMISFKNSLILGVSTALISTLMGLLTAFALPSISSKLRALITGSLLLPLVLPEIAFGIAYLVWFQQLGISPGWSTLLLSHFAFTFCFVVLVLKTSVINLDHTISDAAKDLGASPIDVFRHGVLPQLMPGIIAGAMMAFSLSLDDFLISFFVKGIDQLTLPIKIYRMMHLRIGPEIYALSVVLFGISLASVLLTQLWYARSQKR